MALTNLNGIIGGKKDALHIFKNAGQPTTVAGFWHSYWAATAIPGAGSFAVGNTTTGVIPTAATAGAATFPAPGSGLFQHALAAAVTSTISGTVLMYDRVWHAGAFTPTSGSYAGMVGTAIDRPSTGEGIELWVEIATALSAAAHTLTITYTNQAGDTGRTATVVIPASAGIGRFFPVPLQATDWGVRQVTAMSGSAAPPTGTFNLIAVRTILRVGVVASVPARLAVPETALRPMYANSCLALAFFNPLGTTASTIGVAVDTVEG